MKVVEAVAEANRKEEWAGAEVGADAVEARVERAEVPAKGEKEREGKGAEEWFRARTSRGGFEISSQPPTRISSRT
jgi:hypothetical protein